MVAPLHWLVFAELPVKEAYAPLYAAMLRAGVLLLVGLAFAFVAGLLLARRMVVPIRTLSEGATRIGKGDLAQQIVIKTGDELEVLGGQFNDMAVRLQVLTPRWNAKSRSERSSLRSQTLPSLASSPPRAMT